MKHILAVLWLALVALATPVAAQTIPPLTGRVVDQAGVLTKAQELRLTAHLTALERRTSDQLVIVTIPSLEGQDIAAFGRELGNRWGIGQKGVDNGVLLIVAPNDRKTRIAVGYGLEGLLTDEKAAAVIAQMLPYFRCKRYAEGIERGERRITAVLLSDLHRPQRKRT